MLDLYESCPKCGERLVGADEHCPKCHVAQRKRGLLGLWLKAGAVLAGLTAAVIFSGMADYVPRAIDALRGQPRETGKPGKPPKWTWGGVEPVARAWAGALEKTLADACKETHGRVRDPKNLGGFLAPRLAALDAAAMPTTVAVAARKPPVWRRATDAEIRDAYEAIGSQDAFIGACLRSTYDALNACASFAQTLTTPEAAACFTKPVQRVLAVGPWQKCAEAAQLPNVRQACAAVAVDLGKWEDSRNPPVQ